MFSSLRHPPLDALSDLLSAPDGPGPNDDSAARRATAVHLERCVRCQESLRFLRSLGASVDAMPAPAPPPALRSRVLDDRDGGARTILPDRDVGPRPERRWFVPAVAAALLAVIAGSAVTRTGDVEAGTTSGTLTLTPGTPRPGEAVRVRYRPAAMLGTRPWLALRARLRRPGDDSYNGGLPTSMVARLRRQDDGTFAASFTLPDAVVFAALAVEDSAGTVIDDDASRAWELLVAAPDGRPSFEALDQRAQDMMGRNWEEGAATARRMVALYPDELRGWEWLHAHASWLGHAQDDSVLALHRATLARFDARFAHDARLSSEDMGVIAWYAYTLPDTAVARRWRTRLLREAPANSFAVQWRLTDALDSLRVTHDTVVALGTLETLWRDTPRRRAAQVAGYATSIAVSHGDTAAIYRWAARAVGSARDTAAARASMAGRLARVPILRAESMDRLRTRLAQLAALLPPERGLDETVAEQRARHATAERHVLATLGRALAADRQYAAALDTLRHATAVGWDVDLFRDVRLTSLATGDTAGALRMAARVAADPRTDAAFADTVQAARALGARAWHARLDSARVEFVDRMLVDASVRSLPAAIAIRDLQGNGRDLRALADGHVTLVAFWSRFCGPAIEDLPRMNAVAERLAPLGVRVVSIIEESHASPELTAFLHAHHVTMPTYLDAEHAASRAFGQWGTPYYYVLDAAGRQRFEVTTSADELLARAEALRLAGTRRWGVER